MYISTKNLTTSTHTPPTDKDPPPSQSVGHRPSVADFVDELTEVEHQVSDKLGDTEPRSPGDASSHRTNITASTATRELDELMKNLSTFEPPPAEDRDYSKLTKGPQKPKSAVEDLNTMLGSLDQEMTQVHGVSTVAKGTCAACLKPILAKVVNALGCQWHPEHFTCTSCDIELGTTTYYESNGRPYCEKDFHELYAPRCAYCNGPILEVSHLSVSLLRGFWVAMFCGVLMEAFGGWRCLKHANGHKGGTEADTCRLHVPPFPCWVAMRGRRDTGCDLSLLGSHERM